MRHISSIDLKTKLDQGEDIQIIDTRDPIKFEECHIPGAINIPQVDLPEKMDLIAKDIPVVIYCLYGVKSEAPYLFLREKMKMKNVSILEGGIYQWANDVDQSLPVF
ncbi:MAG: rhodanese-like domain-containing protein [Bacteroidales bacterium]|nr:rhodanese-like domain-containing protein [Bacteroidales bacterium]